MRCAGGKGINISRALLAGGMQSKAFALLGQENADEFAHALDGDGISLCALSVPGRIRENITIHTPGGAETRISFPAPRVGADVLAHLWDALAPQLTPDTVLTLTGRIPDGLDVQTVKHLLLQATALGVRTVIDSKSFSLTDLTEVRPWLIKPNEQEIADDFGYRVCDLDGAARAARDLHARGIANVMISLGGHGAVLACKDGVFGAVPPTITPLSTIGAGDSAIAGFLCAACRGQSPGQCLANAVAFGTAACLTEGTLPPRAEDIASILAQISQAAL